MGYEYGLLEGCEVRDGEWCPEFMHWIEGKNFAHIVDSLEERFISFDVDCTIGEARTAERVRHRLKCYRF
jgi:hypothetical protein